MFRSKLTGRLAIPALLMGLALVQSASAGILSNQLAAKAQPDECFMGIGNSPPLGPTCSGTPKVNQAYVWGLAQSGSQLWFGTAANVECLVLQAYIGFTTPFQTPSYVCEFGSNVPYHTDWRPPKIYSYDLNLKVLTNRSAAAPGLATTLGIRSAGSLGGVVFLAGPTVTLHGIALFAYTAGGTFLGSTVMPNYNDIRQWIVFNGNLYTGVQVSDGTGRVLHWIGKNDGVPADLFKFEEVGQTDAEIAYFASLGNRIYATTWGGANAHGHLSGLWMSPAKMVLGPADNAPGAWQEIWNVNNYEVDPATAQTLFGGAMAAYKGKIYFGLMQVPFTGLVAHFTAYHNAPSGTLDTLLALVGTTRAIPIFRTDPVSLKTELLYGAALLPKYDPVAMTWNLVPNASGGLPTYGPAGFGNPFNTYTWAANVYADRLFFGTFDWSYLLADGLPLIAQELGFGSLSLKAFVNSMSPLDLFGSLFSGFTGASSDPINLAGSKFLQNTLYGADLWRFDNGFSPAKPENVTGVGNYLNYGIRTMISDYHHLYVGTANPMNLKTGPGAKGGWELRIMTKHDDDEDHDD